MTAINAVARDNAAYLLTDAALYDPNGIIQGFMSKVVTFPHLHLAMAVTGSVKATLELVAVLSKSATSFDTAIEGAPDLFRDLCQAGYFEMETEKASQVRLILVGWSGAGRGEAYALSTMDEPNHPAFTLSKGVIFTSPSPAHDDLRRAGIMTEEGGIHCRFADDVPELLGRMVDLQREMAWPVPGNPDQIKHIVGGHATLTAIDKNGISQRVVRRWTADRIGEPIEPQEAPRLVVNNAPSPLNRQQRRALEREQRKRGIA
jgi:hypothetical protein